MSDIFEFHDLLMCCLFNICHLFVKLNHGDANYKTKVTNLFPPSTASQYPSARIAANTGALLGLGWRSKLSQSMVVPSLRVITQSSIQNLPNQTWMWLLINCDCKLR